MNDQDKVINVETLSDKVKGFRVQAREILRMGMINRRLATIYDLKLAIDGGKKNIEDLEKSLVVFLYEATKELDEKHPNYGEMKAEYDESIKRHNENTEECVKCWNESITKNTEEIAKIEKEITEIEAGEKKVNIEDVNDLASQMINKI